MNIETQEVMLGWHDEEKKAKNLKVYESFGWKYTQDVRYGKGYRNLLARDADMPNHQRLVDLEKKYFELENKKKYYHPIFEDGFIDFLKVLVLLILFVLPLVLYLVFKSSRKKHINEFNQKIQEQQEAILKEARSLLPKQ